MQNMDERFAGRGLKPTPPIQATSRVAASASDVWIAINEPGNLVNVHPFCDSNPVEHWPGPAGRDHVYYYSGVHYQRDVLEWIDGSGYDLIVGPPSGKIAVANWRINPSTSSTCDFGIEVTSYVRSDGDPLKLEAYNTNVIQTIGAYLDSVVRGVAHFAETGSPVNKNQFGAHQVYSPDPGQH
tara:strand:+ start:7742 stop:8290 length:549 start_codon:yes stop_codon:yes gene_type:complete